jgi:CMP-N-acetylneuraminic acid synthetase
MGNKSALLSPKVLAIIPARGGSKRVPNKNKKKLNGKEIVRYAIEAALNSKIVTTIIVSSDDEEILKIAKEYDNIIPIERPQEISGDKAPAIIICTTRH